MTAVGVVLALAACASARVPAPTPTATKLDPAEEIGQVIDPVGTTWSGTDSAGDLTVFTLKADHGVKVTFGANSFDAPTDTWSVKAGVLSLDIYINATDGDLDYTGTYDPTAKTIAATATTTKSSKTVMVTLTQK